MGLRGRIVGNDLLQRRRGWADPISRRYTREDCLVGVWLCEYRVLFHLCRLSCRGVLARWLSALALLHALAWMVVVLIRGPENLIFGLPLPLKGILRIGTATPLLTLAAIYLAWRKRTFLSNASAAALALDVPFVFYWNLRS